MNNVIIGCAILAAGLIGCDDKTSAPSSTTTVSTATVDTKSTECRFNLDGMVCQGCAAAAAAALRDVNGVHEANVSFDQGGGTIRYDPSKVTPDVLMEKLKNVEMGGKQMSFKATALPASEQAP